MPAFADATIVPCPTLCQGNHALGACSQLLCLDNDGGIGLLDPVRGLPGTHGKGRESPYRRHRDNTRHVQCQRPLSLLVKVF